MIDPAPRPRRPFSMLAAATLLVACSSDPPSTPVADAGVDAADADDRADIADVAAASDTDDAGDAEPGADADDACDGGPANPCGGCAELDGTPDEPCACGAGRVACDGPDLVQCLDDDGALVLLDGDGDGYAADTSAWDADCASEPAFTTTTGDCDDGDGTVFPGASTGVCEAGDAMVCGDDGQIVARPCPERSTCEAGECVDQPCAPSFDTVCRDGEVYACNTDGTGFEHALDCGDAGCVDGTCDNNPWIVYVRVEPYDAGPELRGRLRLYAIRLDGSDHRLVETDDDEAFAPALSPTGTHLAWTTADDTSVMLRVMDLRTGEKWTTHADDWIGGPSWSPDGTMLLASEHQFSAPFLQRVVPPPAGPPQPLEALSEVGLRMMAIRYLWMVPASEGACVDIVTAGIDGRTGDGNTFGVGYRVAGGNVVEQCPSVSAWDAPSDLRSFGHTRLRRSSTTLVGFFPWPGDDARMGALPIPRGGMTGAEQAAPLPSAAMEMTADGARFVGVADRGNGQVDLVVIDADSGEVVRWLTDDAALEVWPSVTWAPDGGVAPPGTPVERGGTP